MKHWALLALLLVGCASPRDAKINDGWKFVRHDVAGASATKLDDSNWQNVSLRHTWNAKDGQDGGNDYYRGPGWYRRKLSVSSGDLKKRVFLRFEGAATVTQVFVNGKVAGEHGGNFAAFCFEITPLLHAGKDNVIAVRVDNAHSDDIPPFSGDFTIFGGIYRDVHLLVLDPLHITPLDDASPGVYLKQSRVDDSSAEVQVTTKVRNDSGNSKAARVVCTVQDDRGKIVATVSADKKIGANAGADVVSTLNIPNPHLWDGRNDPYLYRAIIEVNEGNTTRDRVTQPLGLRYFRVDPNEGLILNGKRYPLHGVNRHQDRYDQGWAIGHAEQQEDFDIIQEMGCTGVRLAHFQQGEEAYAQCDRRGLVAWAENGLVNHVTVSPAFTESAKQQTRELIKQNFNHPSILCWSLFNELEMRKDVNPDEGALITQLNALAHETDPTRPTACATHKRVQTPEAWITDLTAFNRYFGWYSGSEKDWPKGLDDLHAARPERCIGISEYGAGASLKQHQNRPTTRPRTGGPWHPEEWQGIVHESAWKAMKDRPWLWCEFLWVMFDFAADQRKEGDMMGRNDKGLVSADRKIRKDAFYFYKANWSNEPVLHITSRRFSPRPMGMSDLKVYSNCETVELFLDGKSLGKKTGDTGVFLWPDVDLTLGEHQVRALGIRAGKRYDDQCMWNVLRSVTTMPATTSTSPTTR
jgi:beta-galactosidase